MFQTTNQKSDQHLVLESRASPRLPLLSGEESLLAKFISVKLSRTTQRNVNHTPLQESMCIERIRIHTQTNEIVTVHSRTQDCLICLAMKSLKIARSESWGNERISVEDSGCGST